MAYELYIERSQPVTSEEWLSIVKATDGVKIDGSDWIATNPASGKQIKIPGSPEKAALWFPDLEEWIKVFRFRRGRISFKANDWVIRNRPFAIRLSS